MKFPILELESVVLHMCSSSKLLIEELHIELHMRNTTLSQDVHVHDML